MTNAIRYAGSHRTVIPALPSTGLTLDLDARTGLFQDTGGVTPAAADGDPVGLWRDQSGGARDFSQATGISKPLLKLAQVNGKPALRFDGVDDNILSSAILSAIITASAYSLYVVLNPSAIDTNAANTFDNDAVICDVSGFWGLFLKSAPSANMFNWDGTDDKATVSISTGAWQVIHGRHDSGNVIVAKNNGTEQSAASGNTTTLTATLKIGVRVSAQLAADIARILVYNVAHDATSRAAVYANLKAIYGILP